MIDCDKIKAVAEAKLADTEMFVVGCTCSHMNDVELLIDSTGSILIDDCIALSRAVEEEFDREEEDFALTVASAGIGSELKDLRQFNKLIDRSVEVLLFSGVKIIAKLISADEQGIKIYYQKQQVVETAAGKRKKQMVGLEEEYSFEQIKYTKEYLDFK
ncbi:MAG: ribosome assembly cofactor RimP [Rikenellaceae bacterium]